MTGKPIYHDQEGTQYSPIGHYFPPGNGVPHPARFRSRYWLLIPILGTRGRSMQPARVPIVDS